MLLFIFFFVLNVSQFCLHSTYCLDIDRKEKVRILAGIVQKERPKSDIGNLTGSCTGKKGKASRSYSIQFVVYCRVLTYNYYMN